MESFANPFMNQKEIGPIGAIYEMFCTKDIDWKYQKEWRLIGGTTEEEKYFKEVDIKAVYLGFKVSEKNENRMKKYAKRYGFDLYKMKAPDGKKRIRFYKIS